MTYKRFDGGALIGRTLAGLGVTHLFCLHGGHIDPILYGCKAAGLKVIDARHEAAAVHMAEAWALSTGKVGVCAVTAGPGLANAVTGIANAHQSGTPVVCLAGSSPQRDADTWTLQDLEQLPLVQSISKWARTCRVPSRCGEYAARAFVEARSGRPGPAVLEIPLDVLAKELLPKEQNVPAFSLPAPPAADPAEVDEVAALLEGARRPIAVAGSGAFYAGAAEVLPRLIGRAGIPLFTINAARGVVGDEHPWCAGHLGPAAGAFTKALQADAVLCLGARLGFPLLSGRILLGKKVVRVDIDPGETVVNRPGERNVTADVRLFCEQLERAVLSPPSKERLAWRDALKEAAAVSREQFFAQKSADGSVHPATLIGEVVRAARASDAVLVADGGDTMALAMCGYPAPAPGRVLTTSAYFGCLGVGVPFALGAKIARPERPVFLISGDGAFGFNAMEFDTAVRHDIPIVALVANNGGWGMSRHGQGLQFGYDDLVASELGVRPYHEMVKGLGGYGELVERAEDLPAAIDRALSAEKPACLNVLTDPEVYSQATAVMVGAGIL